MTYTFPLAFPTATGVSSMVANAMPFVALTESQWTGKQQAQRNQGQRWQFDVTLPKMQRANAATWESFFLKLNGKEKTFLMGHLGETTPRGVATGSPLVDGAGQTGQTLLTKGWTISITNIMKEGDWLQLGTGATSRIYRVLDNVNSDGAGKASINVWPDVSLANSPADNAVIVVSSTQGVFRLSVDSVPFNVDTSLLYNYQFKADSLV